MPRALLAFTPNTCAGMFNGGPTALEDEGVRRLVAETDMIMQLVQAGNLRSSLLILDLAQEYGAMERVVAASDTPTGTGVIPLAVGQDNHRVLRVRRHIAGDISMPSHWEQRECMGAELGNDCSGPGGRLGAVRCSRGIHPKRSAIGNAKWGYTGRWNGGH